MKKHPALPESGPLTTEHLSEGLRSRIDFGTGAAGRIADFLTESFGTLWFLIVNFIFFVFWFILNSGLIGAPFDPYPYNFLTLVVSLEAIFLAIIVLMSQNRAGKVADIRQKMDFEINVRAEEEVTELITLVEGLYRHLGVKLSKDAELREMEQRINLDEIRKAAEK